jgi:hypothetical protein
MTVKAHESRLATRHDGEQQCAEAAHYFSCRHSRDCADAVDRDRLLHQSFLFPYWSRLAVEWPPTLKKDCSL